ISTPSLTEKLPRQPVLWTARSISLLYSFIKMIPPGITAEALRTPRREFNNSKPLRTLCLCDGQSLKYQRHSLRLRGRCRQIEKIYFFHALGRRENELRIRQLWRQIPVGNYHRELRLSFNLFRGENEFARQRSVPIFDPDLPVNFRGAKR